MVKDKPRKGAGNLTKLHKSAYMNVNVNPPKNPINLFTSKVQFAAVPSAFNGSLGSF